jgi:3-oxoadipate enol-lactonase
VPDATALRAFAGHSLVIGDELHPACVAERLVTLLPGAALKIYDHPAVLWNNRRELRDRISEFLNTP